MSEEKKEKDLKACPWCSEKPVPGGRRWVLSSGSEILYRCPSVGCPGRCYDPVTAEAWNRRPCVEALEAELAGANKHNDAAIPLDELLSGISDAVMDFNPDLESDSAGTLLERVQTAAECGKKASELEEALRGVKEVLLKAIASIKKDSESCAADAERLKAQGDAASGYVIGCQSMAHELDLKRLEPALSKLSALLP